MYRFQITFIGNTLKWIPIIILFSELSTQKLARKRYDDIVSGFGEYLVSGSDDFTLFLWTPEKDKKSIGK